MRFVYLVTVLVVFVCQSAFSQTVRISEALKGSVYFSHDGNFMLSTTGQLFDLKSGKTVEDFTKNSDHEYPGAFSKSGNYVIYNRTVYDLVSLEPIMELQMGKTYDLHVSSKLIGSSLIKDLKAVAFSNDDALLLIGDQIVDLVTQQVVTVLKPNTYKAGLEYHLNSVFSGLNSSKEILLDGKEMKIFDNSTGKQLAKIKSKSKEKWGSATLSPSGKLLIAYAFRDKFLFNAENGKLITKFDQDYTFISPDDRYLMRNRDGAVYDIESRTEIGKTMRFGSKRNAIAAQFTSNERIVFQYSDGSSRVFDATHGNELYVDQITNDKTLHFTASDNGKWAASSKWDGSISLFGENPSDPLHTWTSVTGVPYGQVVIDTLNHRLFAYRFDNTLTIWNMLTYEQEQSFELEFPVSQLYVSGNTTLAFESQLVPLYEVKTEQFGTLVEIAPNQFHTSSLPPIFHGGKQLVLLGKQLFDFKNKKMLYDFELDRNGELAKEEIAEYRRKVELARVTHLETLENEPDKLVTIARENKTYFQWNFSNGELTKLHFSPQENEAIQFSSDWREDLRKVDYKTRTYSYPLESFLNSIDKTNEEIYYAISRGDWHQISSNWRYVSVNARFSPIMGEFHRKIVVYDTQTAKKISQFDAGKLSTPLLGYFSHSGDSIYFHDGKMNELVCADIHTGKILKRLTDFPFWVEKATVAPNGKWVLFLSEKQKFCVYDTSLENKLMEGELPNWEANDNDEVEVARDNKHVIIKGREKTGLVNIQDKSIRVLEHQLYGSLNLSEDLKFFFGVKYDEKAEMDMISIYKLSDHSLVAIATQFSNSENYLISTPDKFYKASKNSLKDIHFTEGSKTYNFDQFDLRFNRPDIVLERLGYADKSTIKAYRKAWEKRVRKMGFDPKLFDGIDVKINTPEIKTVKEVPLITQEREQVLSLKATDALFALERLHIYVNGTPIFGTVGKLVKEATKQTNNGFELDIEEIVKFTTGKNVVEVSVTNEQGIESLSERFEINCTAEFYSRPNLFIVSIGVSDFEDSTMNLTYAAKDAMDINQLFAEKKSKYLNIYQFTFTNQSATRENILSVKKELLKSSERDEVLVFVASHGLLDDQLDYYIAMHDMDFDNPAAKGLKYDDLESLTDGIPARNKIMFIDACHSGEVDKEESTLVDVASSTTSGVSSRGFKRVVKKEGIGLKSSFELMKELFADLRRGNGTMVISSASGKEFAFESDAWKNGVFTYSLIEGIRTGKADLNSNKTITISELQNYVITKVGELTQGKQTPTSRTEKFEIDYTIW